MDAANRMLRHRRAADRVVELAPRFSPTATGFGGGDTSGGNPFSVGNGGGAGGGGGGGAPPASTPPAQTTPLVPPPASSPPVNTPSLPPTSSTVSSSSIITTPSSSSIPPVITPSTTPRTPVVPSPVSTPSLNLSNTLSGTGAAASNSNTSAPSSGVSTGALIGGIAAGILGLAGIAFAITYFVRRSRKSDMDEDWDSSAFKRQSNMLLDDGPSTPAPARSPSRGYGARPPTMIQRHLDNATPVSSMGAQNGYPYQGGGDYNVHYNQGYAPSPGFQPGQVVNPFYNPYGDNSVSPPPPSAGAYPNAQVGGYMTRSASTAPRPVNPEAHYVDLNRSSVTPFQAEQYEQIHRKLDTPNSENEHFEDAVSTHYEEPHTENHPASHDGVPAPQGGAPPPAALQPSGGGKRDTVYTLYDDEDAYGGI